MLLRAAGKLSLHCYCNKTLPEELRGAETELLLAHRNVLRGLGICCDSPLEASMGAEQWSPGPGTTMGNGAI